VNQDNAANSHCLKILLMSYYYQLLKTHESQNITRWGKGERKEEEKK
jgi:hypothetical protein